MSIQFSDEQWSRVKDVYGRWWAGELDRPVIEVRLDGAPPGRPEPHQPFRHFTAFYDFPVSADEIVDSWDYELSRQLCVGDGFPTVWANFGPGSLSAYIGADLVPDHTGTVWFKPKEILPIEELKFEYDADNPWLRRAKDIFRAGIERWQGRVQMGTVDIGGALDVLSTFRPSEQLMFDLYDKPEEVKRLTWEIHELWWRCFDELNAALQPVNPGFTCWTPIFSEVPYYMFQCDFAYMISPEMFDEFVKPELAASCRRIPHAFYHLDGVGQLPHLDSLLSIPELKGVQWIPGAGQPDAAHWPEVYRKIRDAGKLIQVWGGFNVLDALASQLGSAEGICLNAGCAGPGREAEVMEGLRRYGAE